MHLVSQPLPGPYVRPERVGSLVFNSLLRHPLASQRHPLQPASAGFVLHMWKHTCASGKRGCVGSHAHHRLAPHMVARGNLRLSPARWGAGCRWICCILGSRERDGCRLASGQVPRVCRHTPVWLSATTGGSPLRFLKRHPLSSSHAGAAAEHARGKGSVEREAFSTAFLKHLHITGVPLRVTYDHLEKK